MIKTILASAAVLATLALVSMATAAGSGASDGCPMSGCGGCAMAATTTQPTTQATSYVCPMDKDVTADKPGKCSKCGMKLVPAGK